MQLVASAALITMAAPPSPCPRVFHTLPPVFFKWHHDTWALSRKLHPAPRLMQSRTTCCMPPLPLPPGLHLLTPLPLCLSPSHCTHTHTHPCWYLDVLSIRTWKWGRVQIQALSRKISCSRGSCLPGWIDVASRLLRWWRGLEPCQTLSVLPPLPSASAAASTPLLWPLRHITLLPGILRLHRPTLDCHAALVEGCWNRTRD